MDFIETKITGAGTDESFGTPRGSYPFGNNMLAETTLRYISLKKNGGSIENIPHLRVAEGYTYSDLDWSRNVDEALSSYPEHTFFVVAPRRGYEGALPTILKDGFESTNDWRIPVATILTAKTKMDTAIYVNKERRKVIIFVRKITPSWVELFSSLLFVLVPWLYGESYEGYDETEQEFFKAINKGDSNTFTKIVNELCKDIDFAELKTRAALDNWCNSQRTSQISKFQRDIKSVLDSITSLESDLSKKNVELGVLNENLIALMASEMKNERDEFYKFFKSRGLHFIQKGSEYGGAQYIDYAIVETIENFDKDEFLRIYNMGGSYMNYEERSRAKRLMYAIFAEEKATLRTECAFRLTNLSAITPLRNSLSGFFTGRTLPHPHLYYHACLGNNRGYIDKFLRQGDWDMAIDQTIQAAKNLNFGDSTVVGGLMDRMFGDLKRVKFIILPDGTEMTPPEFANYLDAQEAAQGENNNG